LLTATRNAKNLAKTYVRVQDFLFLAAASTTPSLSKRAQTQGNLLHPTPRAPAGEMKHGPNALIDENLPVIVFLVRAMTEFGSFMSQVAMTTTAGSRR